MSSQFSLKRKKKADRGSCIRRSAFFFPFKKFFHCVFIKISQHLKALAVSGSLCQKQLLLSFAGFIVCLGHLPGDKVVRIPVYKEDRDLRL